MIRRILSIFSARNKEFYRDRSGLGWNLLFPFLLIAGFAAIFGRGPTPSYTVGVVGTAPAAVEALPAPVRDTPFFRLAPQEDLPGALEKLKFHKLDMVLLPDKEPLKYWINESSPKGALAKALLVSLMARPDETAKTLTRETVKGERLNYIDWLFPGILAMNMMFSALFGVGYIVVHYRKNGVLKRLAATPLTSFEFIFAQAASRLVVILFSSGTVFVACLLLFDFQVRGSYLALLLVFMSGALCLISLGLLVASRSASEEFAGGIINLCTWPMMFLSEVWFSLEGAPDWVKTLSRFFPLTYTTEGMREVMNQGAGLLGVSLHLGVLWGMTLLFLLAGSALFRWNPK